MVSDSFFLSLARRHEAVRVLNELVIEDFERLFELHEGDKVEARHRSGKYKAGKVYEDNVDRFTIRFRDGSKAKNVCSSARCGSAHCCVCRHRPFSACLHCGGFTAA